MITIDQAEFYANLRITQAYCEQQLQRKDVLDWVVLRSIINPVCIKGDWFACPPGRGIAASDKQLIPWAEWAKKSDPYFREPFAKLFNEQLECKVGLSNSLEYLESYQGKVLVVEYGENIPDGVAEAETESFFDEWDLPPIDTWFYNDYSPLSGGILFAWIPERFTELTSKAIDVQFLDILHWFEKPRDWKA